MRKITFWLSLLLIFTIPWEDMIKFGSLGTMSHVTGFLLGGFWLATVIITNKIRKPQVFHIVFAAFAFWQFASICWTIDFDKTQIRFLTYLQLIVLAYILWDLYRTPEAVKAGLQAYVLGAWVSISSLVFNYVIGTKATFYRYTATGFDSNNIGIILALGIPIAWYLNAYRHKFKLTHLLTLANYIYLPAAVFGIMLTGSRAALITTGFAFLYVLGSVKQFKFHTRILIYLSLVVAIYGVFTLIPEGILQRLSTTGDSVASADLGGRVVIWRTAVDVFEEHPLIGIGSNAFASSTDLGKAAHNTFLSILVEVGLIGFSLFAIAVAISIYHAMQHPLRDKQFWIALLIVLAVGILTLNWAHRKQTWLFPSLIVASAAMAVKRTNPIQLYNPHDEDIEERMPASE